MLVSDFGVWLIIINVFGLGKWLLFLGVVGYGTLISNQNALFSAYFKLTLQKI